VKTELVHDTNPDAPPTGIYDSLESVFRWDGKKYMGELKLPEIASPYQKYQKEAARD
jgi:hypothetical protein